MEVIYAQKDPYFKGENALQQGVNDCTQKQTTLAYATLFRELIEENENILDFLFSQKSRDVFSKGFQQAALFLELVEAVQNRFDRMQNQLDEKLIPPRSISPILVKGEEFLESLGEYTPPSATSPRNTFFRSRSPSPTRSQSDSPKSSAISNEFKTKLQYERENDMPTNGNLESTIKSKH